MSRSPEEKRSLIEQLKRAIAEVPELPNFSCRCTMIQVIPPVVRGSPARLKEAVSWWFARAETRRVIERMLQP